MTIFQVKLKFFALNIVFKSLTNDLANKETSLQLIMDISKDDSNNSLQPALKSHPVLNVSCLHNIQGNLYYYIIIHAKGLKNIIIKQFRWLKFVYQSFFNLFFFQKNVSVFFKHKLKKIIFMPEKIILNEYESAKICSGDYQHLHPHYIYIYSI